jgi:serine protease AprX
MLFFMRIILFFTLGFLIHINTIYAQPQYAYRFTFKDKLNNQADLDQPHSFLSNRAISKRKIQQIKIDSTDLPVSQNYIQQILTTTNGYFHCTSKWMNTFVCLLNDTLLVEDALQLSFVSKAEKIAHFVTPIHFFRSKEQTNSTIIPNETNRANFRITNDQQFYGNAYDQINLASGQSLHNLGYTGKDMIIAVMDDGFMNVNNMKAFEHLRNNNRIIDSYNFVTDTNDVYKISEHGTVVLSTMAAKLENLYVGTAPEASYALYVTEHNATEQFFEMDNLAAAIERADSIGADISSISLGYNNFYLQGEDRSLTYSDIDGKSTFAAQSVNMASAKGMLMVVTAGNDGATAWKKILTPGDADSALTCGNVNNQKKISTTSGRGPNSAGIMKPDVAMMGTGSIVVGGNDIPTTVNGTSISTPELAGLAACLWQSKPTAPAYQIKEIIKKSAHIALTPNHDMGYGVPNFDSAFRLLHPIEDCINCDSLEVKIGPNPFSNQLKLIINTKDLGFHITSCRKSF